MKTKELIKRLQESDPTGEIECCVGNEDIYFVTQEPAYYDGPLQVLIHDESKRNNCWSIIGGKIIRTGHKIQIHTVSLKDAMFDNQVYNKDFPIEVIGDSVDGYYTKRSEQWKIENQEIINKVNNENRNIDNKQ